MKLNEFKWENICTLPTKKKQKNIKSLKQKLLKGIMSTCDVRHIEYITEIIRSALVFSF